jgi:hypothetical protein
MELQINKDTYEVGDVEELKTRLDQVRHTRYSEVWLRRPGGWPAACLLVNGDAAWMMCVYHEGDSGFSTRNPEYAGPKGAVIECYLANGERDLYPASWNITTSEAIRAMVLFFERGERAPWLVWHEERP